ncbi:hypothetical protein cypCar_00045491 [Cyprinus carpio]|nr:hypothetical protein cypCar_00045491 [Cyprinus carpio]
MPLSNLHDHGSTRLSSTSTFAILAFFQMKISFRSRAGPNVSAAAQSGSHIIAPVLTNNTITGGVHILHNAHGKYFC